ARLVDLAGDPCERLEVGEHPLVRADRGELLLRRFRVVALEDPGLRLHDLAQRPHAAALAVGERASLAPPIDVGIRIENGEELGDEAALADAGNADERDELCRLLALASLERVREEEQLALAPDELAAMRLLDVGAETRVCGDDLPHRDGLRLALRLDGRRLAIVDDVTRRAVRRLADEDAVRRRRRLEARGGVDDVAGDERL